MSQREKTTPINIVFGLVVAAIVGVLAIAILSLPTEAVGLADAVETKLAQAGAKNPVTAVLLNFRGYDTLLEIVVLLLAVIGARVLTATNTASSARQSQPVSLVLVGFIRIIAPVMIVVAGYLLWVGGHAPGGAFQAAAVLAAMGVLLKLGGVHWTRNLSDLGERLLLVAGLTVYLAVSIGVMSDQRSFLEYPMPAAKSLILLIEFVATVSIGAILLALFSSGTLRERDSQVPEDEVAQ